MSDFPGAENPDQPVAQPVRPHIQKIINPAPPLPYLNTQPAGIVAVDTAVMSDEELDLAEASRAKSTWKAYRSDWKDFTVWCQEAGCVAMPSSPETVSAYLRARSGALKVSTLSRRLCSITVAHQARGLESPVRSSRVQLVWKGLKRTKGVAPDQKAPAVLEITTRLLAVVPKSLKTTNGRARELLTARDRALLAVTFFGAFRRSEVAALRREDIQIEREGLAITIRRSKTNQEGALEQIGLPKMQDKKACPVRLLTSWLEAARIESGPLFQAVNRHGVLGRECISGHAVATVIKRTAEAAGLDAADYSGHSLRAGYCTTLAGRGATNREIRKVTRHKGDAMVDRYVRRGTLFDNGTKRLN